MALATDTLAVLKENLIDAGCDEETTRQCMELAKADKWLECIPVLTKYRKSLMDTIHTGQEQLDCLDFLTYRIRKEYKIQ